MTSLDWKEILLQFETYCASEKSWNPLYRSSVHNFAHFLEAGAYAYLNKEVMIAWIGERNVQCTLEHAIKELSHLATFIHYLSEKGLCMRDLLTGMRADMTLLDQLAGPPRYGARIPQLHVYWQAILFEFKVFLRGYAPYQIARSLRVASGYAALLQKHEKTIPDQDTFLEWLDGRMMQCKDSTVAQLLPHLESFCYFFLKRGDCPSNPVTLWRRGHLSLKDALTRRREGKPPQGHPPRFQSSLNTLIIAFIDHKRSLGYTYECVSMLKYFDKYLHTHNVETLSDVDERCLLDFLGTYSHWKDSTRKVCLWLLHEFFRFLERRGEIDPHCSPVRCLPRITEHKYIPHIYTIKEIVAILSELRYTRLHCGFDNHTVVTLIFLIYSCGLRISEALKILVKDVNLKEKTLFIRRTKFGKSRLIPFGCRAGEYLAAYQYLRKERLGEPGECDFFFVRSIGGHCSCDMLKESFRKACLRAGIKTHSDCTPRIHDLRHSFAVHRLYKWYQDGADLQNKLIFLSFYMGHVSIESTQYYLHLSEDLLRLAAKPIERSLDEWIQERQVFHDGE